jgi:hypothetical protein
VTILHYTTLHYTKDHPVSTELTQSNGCDFVLLDSLVALPSLDAIIYCNTPKRKFVHVTTCKETGQTKARERHKASGVEAAACTISDQVQPEPYTCIDILPPLVVIVLQLHCVLAGNAAHCS